MIQLSSFFWMMIVLFAVIGGLRGWQKEVVAIATTILALFVMQQFQNILVQPLTQNARPEQIFYINVLPLLLFAIIGYQAPSTVSRYMARAVFKEGRRAAQESLLGAVIGAANAYLIFGTIWYFLDISGYPFSPYIIAPALNSPSAALVGTLPIVFLVQTNLLTPLLIITFLLVIVALL